VADSDQTQTQIVADKSGNIWTPSTTVVGGGYLHKTPPFGGTGTVDMTQTPVDCSGGSSGYCSLAYPRGIAIDGAGVIWIGNAGMTISSGMIIQPNLTEYNPSLSSVYNPGFVSSSLSNQPQSVAVDISGNVWVLLDNNTITEYIGIATPAVTPLSLAVKKQKLGVKP
jgi:streptogramin lyase